MEWYWIVAIVLVSIAVLFTLSSVFYKQFFKRFYDIVLSGMALIILSPLLLALTVAGTVIMKGNPFFVQPRPGKIDPKTGKERIFNIIKFRTMANEKDSNGNFLPDGERLSNYGKILRSTSLDELGELINIFIGDMTIVGPRPQLVRDMVFMTQEQRQRHSVLPGLTGLAQVSGRNNIPWEKKFEFDNLYISNGISLANDLKIIFMTVGKVFKKCDVVRENTESDMDFGDVLLTNGQISKEEYDRKQQEALLIINNCR